MQGSVLGLVQGCGGLRSAPPASSRFRGRAPGPRAGAPPRAPLLKRRRGWNLVQGCGGLRSAPRPLPDSGVRPRAPAGAPPWGPLLRRRRG
ncbi:hypothetical protein GCM10009579_66770 [Streptomyces javensis]|uniref:Uncharacterized protein n=1 Tax=Streptomyces javensis TaxID=114698 RepID=A0ABN1X8K1_9ACTN